MAAFEVLVKAGCDVNQAQKDGATPVYIVAQNGQTAALDILVKAGCDVNQAKMNGATPAYIVAQNGQTAALDWRSISRLRLTAQLRSVSGN